MFRKIQHNPKVLPRVICNVQFSTPNYYTCKEKTNVIHEKGGKKSDKRNSKQTLMLDLPKISKQQLERKQ